MKILGIDPGLERVGFGVIERVGSRLTMIECGLIQTPRIRLPDRLRLIHDETLALIDRLQPACLITERLLFTANKTTALDVSKALGTILLAASARNLPWEEYSPPSIKQSVVGHGGAEKKQVQFMVAKLLSLPTPPKPDDVADALAIAICHAMRGPTMVLSAGDP
ncbi:MAG: crossover junction endodeoxyribonuclease RuvC [Chthonomonas sp.]|nr:crossover junction endodeoxyribonuclease RuvC [Chthonomonas sp.]